MAVIHNDVLGVECVVPDETVEIWTVPLDEGGPGWIEGSAPWPRDDFGVPHQPAKLAPVSATTTPDAAPAATKKD